MIFTKCVYFKLSHQDIIEACQRKLKVAPTPLFVYSKAQIVKNIRMYLDALKLLDCESQLNYAVKVSSCLALHLHEHHHHLNLMLKINILQYNHCYSRPTGDKDN